MPDLYAAAKAEGTGRNNKLQASTYVKFPIGAGFDFYYPSVYDVALYTAHMATRFVPGSIKNYLSWAKTTILDMGGDKAPFLHPIVAAIVQGATRTISHTPP